MCIKTIGELHRVRHYRCSAPNCTYNYRLTFSAMFLRSLVPWPSVTFR